MTVISHKALHANNADQIVFDQGDYYGRAIMRDDDEAVRDLIINTLTEFGCVGEGYAYADEETQHMSRFYDGVSSQYWVIVSKQDGRIMGGGGFGPLKGIAQADAICEVQKLYFDPVTRGKGLGTRLLGLIVEHAARFGYRQAYLETVPQMIHAQALYAKLGFYPIEHHMGATGHHEKCPVRRLKDLV